MRVVATAGHVDHGKSSLVLALTGTDPDRFPEEKARGLTIDLGFAFCTLPSGQVVGFVDVPGHVRFVKNMLAGVGAVDVALLVVAANEGWMPQTEEHMQILDLLDVRHGMVALSKADAVDGDTLELARLEVEERLSWPVVVVDSLTGRGLEDVRTTLDAVLAAAPAPRDSGRPRLWVDRVFAAKGAGTIVTGTSTGGTLRRDDEVLIEPGGRRARVRRIESHHAQLDAVGPGARVALNLAGVDHHAVQRGDAVVRPGQWAVVDVVDARLRALPGHAFARRATVDVHVGSGEQRGALRVLDEEGAYARIRVTTPLPLAPGDRLVLRSSGAQATVGGAEVLDVAPARRTVDALTRAHLPLAARVSRRGRGAPSRSSQCSRGAPLRPPTPSGSGIGWSCPTSLRASAPGPRSSGATVGPRSPPSRRRVASRSRSCVRPSATCSPSHHSTTPTPGRCSTRWTPSRSHRRRLPMSARPQHWCARSCVPARSSISTA